MGASPRRFESCPHRQLRMINNNQKLTLRDRLAIDRTRFANQRTLLAYCRTALILLVTGISVTKLFAENKVISSLGVILVPVAGAVFVLGIFVYFKEKKNLKKYS